MISHNTNSHIFSLQHTLYRRPCLQVQALFSNRELFKLNILLLKAQCPGPDILLVVSFFGKYWCRHIWSHMRNYSQDMTRKQFQWQLTYHHINENYSAIRIWKKIHVLFKEKMLPANISLIDNFIKWYQTSDSINHLYKLQIHFY